MITLRLEMLALSLACLALAGGCDVPPEESGPNDIEDQAALTPGAVPAVERGEIRVSCQRFFVRRASHVAAELHLLPELWKDTPRGAADCRLLLYANSGAE